MAQVGNNATILNSLVEFSITIHYSNSLLIIWKFLYWQLEYEYLWFIDKIVGENWASIYP